MWLCRAMLGYVGLCKAIERNVFHKLANGEPLYDAYTTYLPISCVPLLTKTIAAQDRKKLQILNVSGANQGAFPQIS